MDPLTILEKRIEYLEQKIGDYEEVPSDNAIEEMKHINSVLNSIGNEKINEFTNRLYELNRYLDPQYAINVTDSKIKSNFIIANEPNIRQHCEYMQLCQEKSGTLNSDSLTSIGPLTGTVEKLKSINLENKEHCDHIEKSVEQAMETYNQVSMSIMENLANLSSKIDALEKMKV